MNSTTNTSGGVEGADGDALLRRGVVAVGGSLLVNGGLLAVVLATGAVRPFQPLSWGSVLFLTAVGALGATVTYWVLVRLLGRPAREFLVVAGAVLLLSFVPDVTFLPTLPGATWGAIAVLMVMHVTVAAVSVGALLYEP